MNTLLTKIGDTLNHISLTLTQWILLSMAGVIGALTVALRLQGSALHKAQVQLLEEHLDVVTSTDDKAVASSRANFQQAYKAYITAKRGQ